VYSCMSARWDCSTSVKRMGQTRKSINKTQIKLDG
jgi:hypothetical protein